MSVERRILVNRMFLTLRGHHYLAVFLALSRWGSCYYNQNYRITSPHHVHKMCSRCTFKFTLAIFLSQSMPVPSQTALFLHVISTILLLKIVYAQICTDPLLDGCPVPMSCSFLQALTGLSLAAWAPRHKIGLLICHLGRGCPRTLSYEGARINHSCAVTKQPVHAWWTPMLEMYTSVA